MSDLVELLNDLNQGNRIEYDDYSQLMFCVEKLEKENAEQKQQIEKMKNVGNCKHSIACAEWNEKQLYLGMMRFCKNCKKWELAE